MTAEKKGITPGLWYVGARPENLEFPNAIYGGDGRIVADARWGIRKDDGTEDANARAIAALPDLVAALEGLQRMANTDSGCFSGCNGEYSGVHHRYCANARAALAKARGDVPVHDETPCGCGPYRPCRRHGGE